MAEALTPFRVGFLVFPHLTLLDLIGPYQVFSRTPGFEVHLVARSLDPVMDQHNLAILPTTDFSAAPDFDLFCVPGGFGDGAAIDDAETMAFVARAGAQARWLTSVCTGSLILGAAGLLKGRRAACHWSAREILSVYGAIPDPARVVEDGHVITGGGVTAGLDFALHVVARLKGEAVAQSVQLSLEYAPDPPFEAGRPETAPADITARARAITADVTARRHAQALEAVSRWPA